VAEENINKKDFCSIKTIQEKEMNLYRNNQTLNWTVG
jgi:hypothetical protein